MEPVATLHSVAKDPRSPASLTPIGPELPAANVTVTPSAGINCQLGVNRKTFGLVRTMRRQAPG